MREVNPLAIGMSVPPIHSQPAFVGRQAELSWLHEQLAAALAGQPRVAFVSGEPGVGKTALLRHLLSEADAAGWQSVWGRCSEGSTTVHLPFTGALVPQLVRAKLLDSPDDLASMSGDLQAFAAALAGKAVQLASRRPLAFVIDDLQFADSATLALTSEFIRDISEAGRKQPVRMLVAFAHHPVLRGDPLSKLVARASSEPSVSLFELGGLDVLETFALIEALTSLACERSLLDSLQQGSRGNPLSLIETLRALERRGRLSSEGGQLTSPGRVTELRNFGVTPALLTERLKNVGEAEIGVLQTCAVLGDAFMPGDLEPFHAGAEAAAAIDDAVLRGLLQEDGHGFTFSHGMVRAAVLESLGPNRLQALHRAVAEALLAQPRKGDDEALRVGAHIAASGTWRDSNEAGRIFVRAADFAMDRFAWGAGLRFYEAALALDGFVDGMETTTRGAFYARAARARSNSGDVSGARALFRAALDCLRGSPDLAGWGLALLGWWRTFTALGAIPPDDREFEDFSLAAGDDLREVRAQLLMNRAEALWIARRDEDEEVGESAFQLAAQCKDPETRTYAATVLALIRNRHLHLDDAIDLFRQAIQDSQAVDNPRIRGWALARLALPFILKGDISAARAACVAAREVAESGNDLSNGPLNLAIFHAAAVLSGDLEKARQLRHEGGMIGGRAMYPQAGMLLDGGVAWARLLRGEYLEAADAVTSWERVAGRNTPRSLGLLIRHRSGDIAAVKAELAERPLSLRRERADFTDLGNLASTIELAEAVRDQELASAALRLLKPALDAGVSFSVAPPLLLHRGASTAARLTADFDQAARLLDLAQRVLASAQAPIEAGLVAFERAKLLHARACSRAEIGAAAVAAADIFRRYDLLGAMTELRAFLDDIGLAGDLPAVAGAEHDLSATEREVLEAWAGDDDLDRIADLLLLSRRTVDDHLARIQQRLHVQTREDAATFFAERLTDSPRGTGSGPLAELTAREREVLGLVARGYTNQQIADELVISLHTAIRHVANILGKTGSANRTEAARLAAT